MPGHGISTEFFDAPAEVLQIETPDKANAFLFAPAESGAP